MTKEQLHEKPRHHGWRISSLELLSIPPELLESIIKLIHSGLDAGALDVPQAHQRQTKEWANDILRIKRQNVKEVQSLFFKLEEDRLLPFFDKKKDE